MNPLFPFPVFILIHAKPSEQLLVPFPGLPVSLIFPCILRVCMCDVGVSSWLFFCMGLCVVVHPVSMGRFVSLCLARPRTSQPAFTSLGPHGQRGLRGFSVCARCEYSLFPKLSLFEIGKPEPEAAAGSLRVLLCLNTEIAKKEICSTVRLVSCAGEHL